jgi:hypothetical protein
MQRWLVHRVYAMRGRKDGRRGLPLVTDDVARKTPLLVRLGDEISCEASVIDAMAVRETAPLRVGLAKLTAPGGEIDRERDRLDRLLSRREALMTAGPETGRRLGEDALSDDLVERRRRREHERSTRRLDERIEAQRTVLSNLAARERGLEVQLAEASREVDARLRHVGANRRAEAATYLTGALRTHRHRPLLLAAIPELTPEMPSDALRRATEAHA